MIFTVLDVSSHFSQLFLDPVGYFGSLVLFFVAGLDLGLEFFLSGFLDVAQKEAGSVADGSGRYQTLVFAVNGLGGFQFGALLDSLATLGGVVLAALGLFGGAFSFLGTTRFGRLGFR